MYTEKEILQKMINISIGKKLNEGYTIEKCFLDSENNKLIFQLHKSIDRINIQFTLPDDD